MSTLQVFFPGHVLSGFVRPPPSWRGFWWSCFVFSVAWTLVVAVATGNRYLSMRQAMEQGTFKTVEGEVRNFKPMPYSGGHAYESFEVEGVPFRYSDYDLTDGGFNNTASHGGPIREGLPVRIAYDGNTILRLEVPADRIPSPTQRSAIVKHGAEASRQAMDQRTPMLGILAAMAVVALLWNLGWRHYLREENPSGPPHSRFREYLHRGFLLVQFVACAWYVIKELAYVPRQGHDYWEDALVFVAIV